MVTAVIPAYNCSGSINEVIKRTLPHVDCIVAVNDGSTDNTRKKLDGIAHPKLVVIHLEMNSGKSNALREGLKKVEDFPVVFLDADLQHAPEEIPKLVHPIINGGKDVVIGSRFLGDYSAMPLPNRFSNRLVSGLASAVLGGTRITDVQSGFRAFSRNAAKKISWTGERFDVDVSAIIDASSKGLRISEVPIRTRYHHRHKEDGRMPSSNIKIGREIARVTRIMAEALSARIMPVRNDKRGTRKNK